ncbi:copper resistance protein B [Spectribacter hydrogenoxidans]|uniref:Copper resistance protein B n=1 Tax=Spectribacter hydrogenoxidans TaxID=3075608 RepID=A0ABU3C2Y8_9GAMM|nr:copper resistance protein B [Salinisphaera sp. W335]MDT0635923.1 copper resistance protein B [Salinisphaera sp. W335]
MFNTRLPLLSGLVLFILALPGLAPAADERELPGQNADPDAIYPPGERNPQSGAPAEWPKITKDQKLFGFALIDRLEYGDPEGTNNYLWDAQGWLGGDTNKFWWKTEGEGPTHGGGPEDTEFQALYNRMISPFFGAQAGIRYDTNPGADRAFGVLGIQGLAPYWFESDTAFFVSEDGDVSFRGEFEYELPLTQRLILQPRLELNASANDVPEYGLGQGLNDTEMGLRLRYEIRREFAPYIGVRYEALYGETEDIAERAGEATSSTNFVIGVRAWY